MAHQEEDFKAGATLLYDVNFLYGRPMKVMSGSAIDISIIFPLTFVRGPTARAIESWTRLQRMSRRRYEVIVVSPGEDPKTEQLIRSRLAATDKLVAADTNNLYALYDLGIQHSQGRIVMITESHVVATRDCLERMVETLDQTNNEAACCNALAPKNEGYLATMEAMLFAEESGQWVTEGSWRRVHERGFAIYRDTYDRYGGFPHEYGWFAGRVFAARLHAAGVPVAYVPDARVVHYNSVKIADIAEGARSFVFGELRYRETEDEAQVIRYFGPSNALEARELYRRSTSLTGLRDWLHRLGRHGWRQRIRTLPQLIDLALKTAFGISLPIALARIQVYVALAKVRALRPWGPSVGLNAYRDYWHRRLVRRFQLEYCRDEAPPADGVESSVVRAQDTEHRLNGFYLIEFIDGEPFRWSKSLASIRVRIPHSPNRIRLETAPIGPPLARRELALYLNGAKLNLEFEESCVVSASIDPGGRSKQTSTLLITSEPLPSNADPRRLGIPFKRMEVVPAGTPCS